MRVYVFLGGKILLLQIEKTHLWSSFDLRKAPCLAPCNTSISLPSTSIFNSSTSSSFNAFEGKDDNKEFQPKKKGIAS